MIAFIDDNRGFHGVEPICRVLPIAPSTYYQHVAVSKELGKASGRARRDAEPSVPTTEVVRFFRQVGG